MIELARNETASSNSIEPSHSTQCHKRNSTQSKTHQRPPLLPSHSSQPQHYPNLISSPHLLNSQQHPHPTRNQSTQEIFVYGKVFQVDLQSVESVQAFIEDLKGDTDLSPRTKMSLQLLVLNKSKQHSKILADLLTQTFKEYEENILSALN